MGRLINGKWYNNENKSRFEFVEEVSLPALREVMPIESEGTMYCENPFSGVGAELTHDAYRLFHAIHDVYNRYTNLESKILMTKGKERKELFAHINKVVYTYDSMRYYFQHHWAKEYLTLLD